MKKNQLKIVYKIIYVQKQSSKSVLQEKRRKNTEGTQGEQPRRSTISRYHDIEITPMHGCTPKNPQNTCKTPLPKRTPQGDFSCMSKEF